MWHNGRGGRGRGEAVDKDIVMGAKEKKRRERIKTLGCGGKGREIIILDLAIKELCWLYSRVQ